jgi:hypothetical protein
MQIDAGGCYGLSYLQRESLDDAFDSQRVAEARCDVHPAQVQLVLYTSLVTPQTLDLTPHA